MANDSWTQGTATPAYATSSSDLSSWSGGQALLGSEYYNWSTPSYQGTTADLGKAVWTTDKTGTRQSILSYNLSASTDFLTDILTATGSGDANVSFYLMSTSDSLGLTIFTGGGSSLPTLTFDVVSVPEPGVPAMVVLGMGNASPPREKAPGKASFSHLQPRCPAMNIGGGIGIAILTGLACALSAVHAVEPVTASIMSSNDAFLLTGSNDNPNMGGDGQDHDLTDWCYGAAGTLVISSGNYSYVDPYTGNTLSKGEYQSVIMFSAASAITLFDSTYGVGNWVITSITLEFTSNYGVAGAVPNNPIFSRSAADSLSSNGCPTITGWKEPEARAAPRRMGSRMTRSTRC